jgi:hypothetical protein
MNESFLPFLFFSKIVKCKFLNDAGSFNYYYLFDRCFFGRNDGHFCIFTAPKKHRFWIEKHEGVIWVNVFNISFKSHCRDFGLTGRPIEGFWTYWMANRYIKGLKSLLISRVSAQKTVHQHLKGRCVIHQTIQYISLVLSVKLCLLS